MPSLVSTRRMSLLQRIDEKKNELRKLESQLRELQSECSHPMERLRTAYDGFRGENYTIRECSNCGRVRHEY